MAAAASMSLSRNDLAVFGALFDPEASLQSPTTIDAYLPEPYTLTVLSEIRKQERSALLLINEPEPAVSSIQECIHRLDKIISVYQDYASAWNNRAQARRMLLNLTSTTDHEQELSDLLDDLSKAIDLASPQSPTEPVSISAAKVLASAYTHRGYLLWRASQPDSMPPTLGSVRSLRGMSREQLEELASKDFSNGGRYGNQMARQLAVKTNPYAKLCGNIVKEAMQKEIADFYQKPEAAV